MKRYWLLLFVMAGSLLYGCRAASTPAAATPTQAPPATNTVQAAAPTALAVVTATSGPVATSVPATETPTSAPAPTETQAPAATQPQPTATTQITQTTAATNTPTPAGQPATGSPTVLVNQNTNCRSGPSALYDLLYTAMAGQELTVASASSVSNYVVVNIPDQPGKTCWLWTQFATVKGDLSGLAVAAPPPVPFNFAITYYRVEVCNGWMLAFKVQNIASTTLQSYTIVAKDLTENTQETTTSNDFTQHNGCTIGDQVGSLDPSQAGYMYSGGFTFDPTGDSMDAVITVCSHDDLAGKCATEEFKFTP